MVQVHVPIYELFPGPYNDILARIAAMELKCPVSEHKGDTDPLDATPIHHLNTSMKTTADDPLLYEVLGHADHDAALNDLGKKSPNSRGKGEGNRGLNMYVLGLWFAFGNTTGAYFFFSGYNVRIPLDEPITIVWCSSFTHGSYGSVQGNPYCELVGTALDVSQRAMSYLQKRGLPKN